MPETQRSEKRKRIIVTGMLLLLVGLAGGGWWWYQSTKVVSTDDARISGTIVSVSSKIPGRIAEVLVKEGATVTTGQLLARIDGRDASVQKSQAEAALAAAKAGYDALVSGSRPQEIDQARAELEKAHAATAQSLASLQNAEKTYQRMNQLYADGVISASQMDNAEAAYLMAKEGWRAAGKAADSAMHNLALVVSGSREEDIRTAAALVKQGEANLAAAQLTVEYTDILSPVDGVVALKAVNTGEVVTAGQTLFSVVDSNDLWLNARIEETKIGKIKPGQKVNYTIDGYAGRRFTGQVYEVGIATNSTFALVPTENTSGNFTKVTQHIPIKITLPANSSGIIFRPGMQALIAIHLQ
ncbi:HlyD family secretion protein [Sporomusa sp. KB1]|jgi:multidrug resistance efflux pump|uniref:HlyD family secretion protein n=1 Tax=Sporomusa sp. KB1 TaxID=943346 RepID=UPI0011A2D747|nr:HlyD family secretion protein [Sporomusa sp. KB1]TWH51710.1 membrane fusion protein (multidrug efflux system) [Sporomusa sp. KB1]